MKYEESWRRIRASASHHYADIFLRGLGQAKARDKRIILKNKTWIRIAGLRYEVQTRLGTRIRIYLNKTLDCIISHCFPKVGNQ